MALIGRIIVIIFAVMVASLAAGMAIATGLLGPQWHSVSGDVGERVVFWGATFVGATATGAVGLLPLTILIALGETFKIRSLLANTAAGAAMLPVIRYSVLWWNTLHQPGSLGGIAVPMFHASILTPLLLMALAFVLLFVTLHVAAMRNEILRQRVQALRLTKAMRDEAFSLRGLPPVDLRL